MDVRNLRVGVAALAAAVISTAGAATTWGVYSNRIQNVEQRVKETESLARSNQIALAVTQAQYAEIIKRLDRIERRLKDDGLSQESRN